MAESVDVSRLRNVAEFEEAARAALPEVNYARVAGGAGADTTVDANMEAFRRWVFLPRVLVDIRERDPSTEVLGHRIPFPVIVAPFNQQAALHPEAELATVAAASSAGTVMVVSMGANRSLEEIAARATVPLWFQPYVCADLGLMRDMVERATAAGYAAIVFTVDAPVNGWREADMLGPAVVPAGEVWPNMPAEFQPASGRWLQSGGFDWAALEEMLAMSSVPVVLKGIVHPGDARRAADAGAAAIVVSNHGGRQLGDAIATLDALPAVAEAVGDRAEVLVDGGIRRGTDVAKALALGARAVLAGRAVAWGLAAGGRAGVERVLALLRGEFESAMANLGVLTVAGIVPELLVPAPDARQP